MLLLAYNKRLLVQLLPACPGYKIHTAVLYKLPLSPVLMSSHHGLYMENNVRIVFPLHSSRTLYKSQQDHWQINSICPDGSIYTPFSENQPAAFEPHCPHIYKTEYQRLSGPLSGSHKTVWFFQLRISSGSPIPVYHLSPYRLFPYRSIRSGLSGLAIWD